MQVIVSELSYKLKTAGFKGLVLDDQNIMKGKFNFSYLGLVNLVALRMLVSVYAGSLVNE